MLSLLKDLVIQITLYFSILSVFGDLFKQLIIHVKLIN